MQVTTTITRLDTEIRLLYVCERVWKLPAGPVIRQLVQWEDAPLPDLLPPVPEWVTFQWPASRVVNFEDYWRAQDGGVTKRWAGPYL